MRRADLRLAGLLVACTLLVRVAGVARTKRLLNRWAGESPAGKADVARARRLAAHHAHVAAILPRRPSCLPRSLALWFALRRRGMPADVVFGAKRKPSFEAHAWVEVAGAVVNDSDDVRLRYGVFA